jgi:uncharacterized protein with FMN-binding domain
MQSSRLIASLAIVGIVVVGIGSYIIYGKNDSRTSLDRMPTTSASNESVNTTNTVPATTGTNGNVNPAPVAHRNDDEDSDEGDDDDMPVKNPVPVATPVDTTKKSTYKDGTYSAIGTYNSPGGKDQLGVSITLKNNIVVDATVTNMAGDRTSKRYEDAFISGYKTLVIGKNIDTLQLDVVSGSSLTPIGFNNAIAIIKAQAKA